MIELKNIKNAFDSFIKTSDIFIQKQKEKAINEMVEYLNNYTKQGIIDIKTLSSFNYDNELKQKAVDKYCDNLYIEEERLTDFLTRNID